MSPAMNDPPACANRRFELQCAHLAPAPSSTRRLTCGGRVTQAIYPAIAALCAALKLVQTPGQPGAFHYIGAAARPAAAVSLRTIDPDHFAVVDETSGDTIEAIEACKAFFQVCDLLAVQPLHNYPFGICCPVSLELSMSFQDMAQ